MAERDSRNYKELEEFVLVKNDKTPIFREIDVKVVPIAIGKNGPEFEILDKENNRIGMVKDDKTFEFDGKYKEQLKEKMGLYYEKIGFDDEELKFDVMQKIREQENLKRNREQMYRDEKNLNRKNNNVSMEKGQDEGGNENKEGQSKYGETIEKEELEEQGIKTVKQKSIKDQQIIDSMISGNIDPRTVTVAEMADGNERYKFIGREKGPNGKIVELDERAGGKNYSAEEVNAIRGNRQVKESAGDTKIMPDYGNTEFSIKSYGGDIDVRVLDDIDEDGTRDAISVDTDTNKTTMQEYNRRRDERLDDDGEISGDSILMNEEVEEIINSNVRHPAVKKEVEERLSGGQNHTKEEVLEIIEDVKEEFFEAERRERKRGK